MWEQCQPAYRSVTLRQTLATFGKNGLVSLMSVDTSAEPASGEQVVTEFTLTFEEMGTLVEAFQAYLVHREATAVPDPVLPAWEDAHPF